MIDCIVDGLNEALQTFNFSLQGFTVGPESGFHVEIRAPCYGFDLVQAQLKFPIEQDLLEFQQGFFFVVAVAVPAQR